MPNLNVKARLFEDFTYEERATAGSDRQERELAFASTDATPTKLRNLGRGFERFTSLVGLLAVRLHDLCRAVVGLLLGVGAPPLGVHAVVRRADIDVTMTISADTDLDA